MKKKILIKNIKQLVQVTDSPKEKVAGADMAELPIIENAYVAIEGDKIVDFGSMDDLQGIADWSNLEIVDAEGKTVLPAWVDSHTHLVFARTREEEFVDRIKGLTYEEIAKKGGGILNSAKRLQEATEDELFESALQRLNNVMKMGTGAIEIKSGYGLTVEAELKMLRVIKRLKEVSPVTIKANFLGAHAFPLEYKENHEPYIDKIINEMLPVVAEEGLADYIDTFCERGYYSVDEMTRILKAGIELGLTPKVHVNQFSISGGIKAAVDLNALSVDHLEVMGEEDFEALVESNTMPTLLPSCSFFLKLPYAPAREMIDKGLPVALATDYNPGSTPSGKMAFVMSLACIYMGMTPEEAINAMTLNTAYAMGISDTHGSITIGKKANLIITKDIPSLAYIPYSFGEDVIDQVIINGEIH